MSSTFEIGAEFAGYRILEVIGSGGFADVYLGEEVSPAKPLSRVWQARLGEQWVPVNQAAVSWLWFENPVRTFKAIPGLPGYDPTAHTPRCG